MTNLTRTPDGILHPSQTAAAQADYTARILAALEPDPATERMRDALIWCSGSDDFQEGGKARAGWLKLCAPLIHGDTTNDY